MSVATMRQCTLETSNENRAIRVTAAGEPKRVDRLDRLLLPHLTEATHARFRVTLDTRIHGRA